MVQLWPSDQRIYRRVTATLPAPRMLTPIEPEPGKEAAMKIAKRVALALGSLLALAFAGGAHVRW